MSQVFVGVGYHYSFGRHQIVPWFMFATIIPYDSLGGCLFIVGKVFILLPFEGVGCDYI